MDRRSKNQITNKNRVQFYTAAAGSSQGFKLHEVYTVENLGLPERSIDFCGKSARFKHLPVTSFDAAIPSLLMDLTNIHLLDTLNLREGRVQEPISTKTRIGCSMYGCQSDKVDGMLHRQLPICAKPSKEDLYVFCGYFGVALVLQVEEADEQRARIILKETTERTSCGRFQAPIETLWIAVY